ncbi:MAG TPA: hypothetical protein VMY06_00545, partial [Sedimentisphaerales bacterium]|nr:hypothetical protein [Sedimentisphaerales bacterium]
HQEEDTKSLSFAITLKNGSSLFLTASRKMHWKAEIFKKSPKKSQKRLKNTYGYSRIVLQRSGQAKWRFGFSGI